MWPMSQRLLRLPTTAPRALAANARARQLPQCRNLVEKASYQPITLSPTMLRKATRTLLNEIDLVVYDMAGTTVQEGGIVYKTLQLAMREDGLQVSDEDMHPWHGAKKEAVIEHFALKAGTPPEDITERVTRVGEWFVNAIDEAYFNEASAIDHIDIGLLGYFRQLKDAGIKIAFDTGYPENIQKGLIKRLGFDKIADAYISSYQVTEGRPYPYMIHHLMERTQVMNVKRVCKVGDSVRDIEEGRNAGCGLVVGVLSGADGFDDLMKAGAHVVCERVTDLPVPRRHFAVDERRLPDLS
ncbi:phnX [Symbiodinium sp. CCMP2592]|nr:phnX [Symbiodinium sp. CCMP2592]